MGPGRDVPPIVITKLSFFPRGFTPKIAISVGVSVWLDIKIGKYLCPGHKS